jgi:3D (Asp-Asp-Asp) domain-containing protein
MKYIPMISIVCSLVLSSCGDFDSSAFNSKSEGIHTRGASNSLVASKKSPFNKVKSTNGFHPASVSLGVTKKAENLSKDKHGMPTYPLSTRQRVVRTTAYSHEENEVGAPWMKNALGTYLKYGHVRSAAADWSKYPVGTKFKIKGLPHTYIVDDYGSALVGTNTIDIYHPNLSTMRLWGTRKAEISVIQWGDWDRTLNILSGRKQYPHTRRMYYAAKAKVDSGQVARN